LKMVEDRGQFMHNSETLPLASRSNPSPKKPAKASFARTSSGTGIVAPSDGNVKPAEVERQQADTAFRLPFRASRFPQRSTINPRPQSDWECLLP